MPESSVQEHEELPPDAAIAADHRNPRRRNRQGQREEEPEVGHAHSPGVPPSARRPDPPSLREAADTRRPPCHPDPPPVGGGLGHQPTPTAAGTLHPQLLWPAGTGKTRAALGVALKLGQPLYQVDYSAVISKYLGDTGKGHQAAPSSGRPITARHCSSTRPSACSPSESASTNLFGNYDEDLLRRVRRHIQFRLPNAIHAGSRDPNPAKWMVTEKLLMRGIRRAKGRKGRRRGTVGRSGAGGSDSAVDPEP